MELKSWSPNTIDRKTFCRNSVMSISNPAVHISSSMSSSEEFGDRMLTRKDIEQVRPEDAAAQHQPYRLWQTDPAATVVER